MNSEDLKKRSEEKQRIVKETGYKTTCKGDKVQSIPMSMQQLKELVESRLFANGETLDADFVFGDFQNCPNSYGVFNKEHFWFLYSNDEKNIHSINGPFTENEIVYAIAKKLHKSQHFEDYKFGNDAKHIYIHNHYRSVEEAINATR